MRGRFALRSERYFHRGWAPVSGPGATESSMRDSPKPWAISTLGAFREAIAAAAAKLNLRIVTSKFAKALVLAGLCTADRQVAR